MSGEGVQQRVQNKESGQSALETLRVLNLNFIEKNNCWRKVNRLSDFPPAENPSV